MILAPGTRLGPYEILSLLGAGGMGQVWKARDTRLDRLVAIKTSASRFSARFDREARAIAAVNHPRVCSIYDVGPDYLVMEYVEGEWLRGQLPIPRALLLADQILDAIDAAHRKGVVHRDLKPGNILLTKSGVKVLDFGLAKIERAYDSADSGILSDTLSAPLTAEGSVLGTLPYMSPEQVEGREADTRSDLFAFGIVLYELIAGTRPFAGETPAELGASILREEPRPLIELQPRTPPGLAAVVQTCLEKDPENRWQSARDVRHALTLVAVEPPQPIRTRSVRVWQGLAVAAAVVALGIGGWVLRPMEPAPLSRFEAPIPENVTSYDDLSVSPEGRRLVLAAQQGGLWLRDLGGVEWRPLPGTDGAVAPFWSPDGRYLAFTVDNVLKKIDVTGGPPETVASLPDVSFRSGTWSGAGDVVLGSWGGGPGGPLWRVSQAGAISALTEVDAAKGEFFHTWPTFLPDGRHFLYFRSGPPDVEGMYVGSLDVDAADQSRQRVLAGRVPATYANGHVLFPRERTLMAQPFDVRRFEPRGAPVSVAEDVQISWYSTGAFSASGNGVLAYRAGSVPGTSQFTWVDRQGKALSTVGPPGTDWNVVLSPDGTRAVAKDAPYNTPGDLWTLDIATGRRTRLTFKKDVYSAGVWSPDGARIAYSAGQLGDTIFEKAASGLGDEQVLLEEPGLRHVPTSWSNGFLLYHTENAPRTGYDLWALSLRDRRPQLLLGETFNEWAGVFSPDTRWVAYVSLESGAEAQVYVRPFSVSQQTGQPSLAEGQWQVSKDRGNWPQWRVAREIVFTTVPTGTEVFAAGVSADGAAFQSGVPQQLPFPPNARVGSTPQSAADGRRFLIEVPQIPQAPRTSISVVLNWQALSKQ